MSTELAPRESARRTPWRILLLLVYLAGLTEFIGRVGLSLLRESSAAMPAAEIGSVEVPERTQERLDLARLHPYLGFLPVVRPEPPPAGVELLSRPEFYGPESAIFSEDPGDLIVGITGGSVAAQFLTKGGAEVLAPLLEGLPRFEGRRVRFAGLAFGGMKQPQQLMALQYVLSLGGRIDLLVALDGFNEVGLHEIDNQKRGVSMIYPRMWYWRTVDQAAATPRAELAALEEARRAARERLERSVLRHSALRRLFWRHTDLDLERRAEVAYRRLLEAAPGDAPAAGPSAEPSQWSPDMLLLGPPGTPTGRLARSAELAKIWGRSALQTARSAEANGIEFHQFLQPNQYVPDSKPLSAKERAKCYTPGLGYGAGIEYSYPLLQAEGARISEEGVAYHDLTGIFRDVEQTVYVDSCCHVNALGNRLMAQAITAAVAGP